MVFLRRSLALLFFVSLRGIAQPHLLIDPGHGGRDQGAQVGSLREAEVAWRWALALKKSLLERGFQVTLSRDETSSQVQERRLSLARDPHFDLVISLHANYLQDPRVKGLEYYILNPLSLDDQKLQLAHDEVRLAKTLQENSAAPNTPSSGLLDKKAQVLTIVENLKHQARIKTSLKLAKLLSETWPGKLKQGPFEILSQAQAPAVLLELGFLSSPVDQKNLVDPQFISQQTQKLAQSLVGYFAQKDSSKMNP
ncbi:MAG: N-acetylmuramoyl-L-alanine amidase [Bdellovibrionales bacterium]